MEQKIYIINGEEIDLTNYSQSDRIIWLSENPGAELKKVEGVVTDVNVAPLPNMFASQENGELTSENISSESTNELDDRGLPINFETHVRKRGQANVGLPEKPQSYYDNMARTLGKTNDPKTLEQNQFGLFEDTNVQLAVDQNFITEDDLELAGYTQNQTISTLNPPSQSQIDRAKAKISTYQVKTADEVSSYIDIQKLNKPYIYEGDLRDNTLVNEMYNGEELVKTNLNINDFGGFLQERGFDKDLKRFLELDMDERNYASSYNPTLAFEAKKLQYLNMYINDQVTRDIKQQKLMYEQQNGVDPDLAGVKFNISSENVKLFNYEKFIKKEFPLISQKLQEQDEKNAVEYQELLGSGGNIGTGKFLLNTVGEGWNGLSDAFTSFSASAIGILPGDFFEGTSESIRTALSLEEMGVIDSKYQTFGRYVFANGYTYTDPKSETKYIIDANNRIIDATRSLDATPFLSSEQQDEIRTKARQGGRKATSFSVLGAFDAGSNVVGDLVVQLALTRGMGVARQSIGGFAKGMGVLGKTRQYLKTIPIKRGMADAIIGQSTLGFSRGYEETLKQARQAGFNDDEASSLAAVSSIETGLLYALTAPISPQTRATDALFGKLLKPSMLKDAFKIYRKEGLSAYRKALSAARTSLNITGEGLKEVFQENVQQIGEVYGVNRDINEIAGKNFLKDTISGQDFMDTIVLSFFAGALIPGAGVTLNLATKTGRQLLGMDAVDRFNALSYMSYNKKKSLKLLSKQVEQGIYTQQEADQLIEEMDAFNNSINRMPTNISASVAEKILGDLKTLGTLRQNLKSEDKSFRAGTEEKIKLLEEKISRTYYDEMSKKTGDQLIQAIKDNTLENTVYKEFDTSEEAVDYLMNELGFTRSKAEKVASQYGMDIQMKDGRQFIGINNALASKDGAITTKQHEFIHGIIYKTIKGDPEAQILIGRAFTAELLKLQEKLVLNDSKLTAMPEQWLRRFSQYIEKYSKKIAGYDAELKAGSITKEEHKRKVDKALGNQWEETLPLYSEAISNGAVTYDEDIFTKLGDILRQVLQYFGRTDIKFNSGRSVYNFIKDFNATLESGNFNKNKAFKKLTKQGAEVDKKALKKEISKVVDETKPPTKPKTEIKPEENVYDFDEKFSMRNTSTGDDFKLKVNSLYNKNKWGNPRQVDNVLYEVLQQYEDVIAYKAEVLYGNLPDYSAENMLAETQVALIPHIRNFNKEFLKLRENKRKELTDKGLTSNEINSELNKLDVKGYKNSKGNFITENNNLNGWINAQLRNKMKTALKTGTVTTQKFTEEFDANKISDENQLSNEEELKEEALEFENNQDELVELLKDPVFGFTNEDGKDVEIEAIPLGGSVVFDVNDPSIPANKKLKTEQDPKIRKELKKELKDLERGLELEAKENLTESEIDELKELKSFKTYDLMFGLPVKTYKALSELTSPAKVIISQVKKQILNAPNIETLDFKNFKEKLATLSKTLSRRITFKNRADLDVFMYNNWELIWNVINNPIDPVTGESTYDSKKTPPRLKAYDDIGKPIKMKPMTRVKFLQSFYGLEETTRLIRKYGGKNIKSELSQLQDTELNPKKGTPLWATALFDRRTALMERFGDVIILQEGRNALRDKVFLKKIANKNVNLYNILKDENIKAKVISNLAQGKSDVVKFSLAEKRNGKISNFLDFANDIEQQFYMARVLDGAKIESIKYNKKAIKFKVPNLGDLNNKTVAYYLLDKINQGYNDFYFRNNDNWKSKEVKDILEIADVKFALNNERNEYAKNLDKGLNEIIEDNKGINEADVIGKIIAQRAGKNKGKYNIWLPAADQDFLGLMYVVANAKGSKGEKQLDYLRKALIDPYSDGMLNLMQSRQSAFRDWKNLIKNEFKGIKKTLKENSGYENFTKDEAIRVYLWNNMYGLNPELNKGDLNEITGLTPKDVFELSRIVRKNKKLKAFANKVAFLSKQPNGYLMPTDTWADTTILNDVQNNLGKVNRKKYLVKWQENVDLMFTKENLSKLEYAHGTRFVNALNDILYRMKTGSNKPTSNNAFIDWVNGSIGVTMFFNMRSALLQTISASNFINTSDNNIFAAGAAIANVPQAMRDFSTLWNSDYLKDRRAGLMSDIQEAEILDVIRNPKYTSFLEKGKAGIFYLLKQGYTLTRAADAFAIASGGAIFYRNRIKSLVKSGMTEKEAELQAYKDFYTTAEVSQQSADPSKISQNQASIEGRLILSFMNTPLQYGRIIKKSAEDIYKGRGNVANNFSKIMYYAVLQNVVFNYLQQGLMAKMWGDEDDEDWETQSSRFYEGWVGTLLKGSGLKMAIINGIIKVGLTVNNLYDEENEEQNKFAKILLTAADISPPIGIKARKFNKAWNTLEYNKAEAEWLGWSLDNKYYIEAGTTLTSGLINLPLDRMYQKFLNLQGAMDTDYENYQRIMMFSGFNKYNLGLDEGSQGLMSPPSLLKLPKLKSPKLKFPTF